MDRTDELKHEHTEDDRPAREGDVLGLGGATVPKAPGDPTTAHDPQSEAQRRARMRSGEAEDAARPAAGSDSAGATGIDMGAGGHGTDVSGD